MVDKYRVKVLNTGETTRLEQVTERINKKKQNLAKELRDIQNARLLFEANKRSKQEQKSRRSSDPVGPKPQSLQYMQNSISVDVGPINSHPRSHSRRLFSNSSRSSSHNDLLRMKNEEISTHRQGRRVSLMNKSDGWTLSSAPNWKSYQETLNRSPKRRISLPTTAAPMTCSISSNGDKWNKDEVLDNIALSQHMSKSSSNRLIPPNWNLSCSEEGLRKVMSKQSRSPRGGERSKNCNLPQETNEANSRKISTCPREDENNKVGSEEILGKEASSSCQNRNAQHKFTRSSGWNKSCNPPKEPSEANSRKISTCPREDENNEVGSEEILGKSSSAQPKLTRNGRRNKNLNLHQELPGVNLRETPFCCPFVEENNDVDSKDLSVMSDNVYGKEQEGSSEDTKLKLPVIAATLRSQSPLSHTDNHGSLSVTDMRKKRRKISPSSMTLGPFHSKNGHVDSGELEVGVRVFTPAERRSSIKKQKAMASIEIERLTRSKEELDQAMMSKFKRIGVGEMGHMVLRKRNDRMLENMESMESPGLINTHVCKYVFHRTGSKATTESLSPSKDLAVTDLSDIRPADPECEL